MHDVYQYPKYYEIAFSWRDITKEVDVLEEAAARFATAPVRHFLELACGNSPHMQELATRGYDYTGIDLSEPMLAYSRDKAHRLGLEARLIAADMVDFALDHTVDFAYVMLGSFFVKSTDDLVSHFDSVARALRPGGLYFLDWCIRFNASDENESSWVEERDGIRVKASFASRIIDRVEQIYEDVDGLEVWDDGEVVNITSTSTRRVLYPQEFLFFVAHRADFEFIGWWNDWDLSAPLRGDEDINRPIALLRRR